MGIQRLSVFPSLSLSLHCLNRLFIIIAKQGIEQSLEEKEDHVDERDDDDDPQVLFFDTIQPYFKNRPKYNGRTRSNVDIN
jgi:hypothetical protein